MNIFWTDTALSELHNVCEYYKNKNNEKAACQIRKQAFQSVHILKTHPSVGQVQLSLK